MTTITTVTTTGFGRMKNSIKLDEGLTRIICQIQNLTSDLDMFYRHKTQIHPLCLREAITSSQYSLLCCNLQQSNTARDNLIHETVRLGLLMYLVTLVNESPPGISLYDMLGARLKSALIEIKRNEGLDLEFSLWIMFIATSMVRDPDTKGYFMASATDIMMELGVSCWENVEILLKSFFWVEKIHRGAFKPIWNALEAASTHTCK